MASDKDTTIQAMKDRLASFVTERDWDQYHHPKEVAISLSVEAGELLEIFQWMEKRPVAEIRSDARMMAMIRDELADVAGYCIDLASRLDIDLSTAFFEKMERNNLRYPIAKSRGNHKKYTEL